MRGSTWRPLCGSATLLLARRTSRSIQPAARVYRNARTATTAALRRSSAAETTINSLASSSSLPAAPSTPVPQNVAVPSFPDSRSPQAWLDILESYLQQAHAPSKDPWAHTQSVVEVMQKALANPGNASINIVSYIGIEKGGWELAGNVMSHAAATFKYFQYTRAARSLPHGHVLPYAGQSMMSLDRLLDVRSFSGSETLGLVKLTSQRWSGIAFDDVGEELSEEKIAVIVHHRKLGGTFLWALGGVLHDVSRMMPSAEKQKALEFVYFQLKELLSCESVMDDVLKTYRAKQTCCSFADAPLLDSATLFRSFEQAFHLDAPGSFIENAMEFITWACIHSGHHDEASSLILGLRCGREGGLWELASSRSHRGRQQQTDRLRKASRQGQSPLSSGLVTQPHEAGKPLFMSKDVVVALIEATVNDLSHPEFAPKNRRMLVQRIQTLYALLERYKFHMDNMSADALVGSLVDLPGVDLANDPALGQEILALAKPVTDPDKSRQVGLSEHTAVLLTMYHRRLGSQIQSRNVHGAVKTLSELQEFTDMHQRRTLNTFFQEIKAFNRAKRGEAWTSGEKAELEDRWPGSPPTNAHLALPNTLAAALLDLVTESAEIDVGKWLLYGSNVAEGPLIKPSMYSDEAIAPALVRYAAVAQDKKLMSRVLQMMSADVSGDTLVALCENRFQSGEFKEALKVLALVREYAMHTWTARDAIRLIRSLFRHLQEDAGPHERGTAHAMILKLVRGDLGIVADLNTDQLVDIARVLSDADTSLRQSLSNVTSLRKGSRKGLSTEDFNVLLAGVAQAFGSSRAQGLYQKWCLEEAGESEVIPRPPEEESVSSLFGYTERPKTLARSFPLPPSPRVGVPLIDPTLATIRIVIGRAVQEHQDATRSQATEDVDQSHLTTHAVLDWAAQILHADFKFSEADIDYELQGYISAKRSTSSVEVPELYKRRTLLLWRAASAGHRHEWAVEQERTLREFAQNPVRQRYLTQPISAVERALVHAFCHEFGLESNNMQSTLTETLGDEEEFAVLVTKPKDRHYGHGAHFPKTSVQEAARAWFATPQWRKGLPGITEQDGGGGGGGGRD